MLRILGEGVLLFLLPFLAYVAFLVLQRRFPFVREAWGSQASIRLAAAGLAFAILGLLALGLLGERYRGVYVPAHLENGRLIPGRMQ